MTTQSSTTPRRAAKRLNDHHMRTCAGFYCTTGHRFFMARVRAAQLECSPDFGETWVPVDLQAHSFTDHNGRPIYL